MHDAMTIEEAVEELALKYGLLVFHEIGFGGTMFHLVRRQDADLFMLQQWEPVARCH